jgi:general secretion pathway protein A
LAAFDLSETAAYIAGRIRIAGGAPAEVFTRNAVDAVFRGSKGIPRVINVICHNALVNGFAADQKPVGASIVVEVCRSLALTPEETYADAATQPPVAPAPAAAAAPIFADVGRRRFSFF